MLICQAKDTFYATGPDFVGLSHMSIGSPMIFGFHTSVNKLKADLSLAILDCMLVSHKWRHKLDASTRLFRMIGQLNIRSSTINTPLFGNR